MGTAVCIDPGREAPGEATILKFRHLREAHQRGDALINKVLAYLYDKVFKLTRHCCACHPACCAQFGQ